MAKRRRTKHSSLTRRDLLKNIIVGAAASIAAKASTSGTASGAVYWQKYTLALTVHVPRVYSNSQSLGYRKYQRQRIVGKMAIGFGQDNNIIDI